MKKFIFLSSMILISLTFICCEKEDIIGHPWPGAAYLLMDNGEWNLVKKQATVKMPKDENELILTLRSDGFTPGLIEVTKKSKGINLVLMDTIPDEEYYAPFDYNNMRGITQRIKITTDPNNKKSQSISFTVHTYRTYNGFYSDFKVVKK